MYVPARGTSRVRFGEFEVDLRWGQLCHKGDKIKLQERPFQILAALLRRPGEVVTREEIQQELWPADTFVDFEHSINTAVNKVREALGDDAEKPRFIETLPRHGYRFIAPVDIVEPNGTRPEMATHLVPPQQGRLRGRPLQKRWLVAAVIGALVTLLAVLFAPNVADLRDKVLSAGGLHHGAPLPKIQSLAVLPLANLSGDPAQEYFSDGMTDALITDLSQIGSLKVISRTTIMRYKRTDKSLPEIARELNVDGIVEGTVQRSDDRVRITAQLIHGPSDKHIWASTYERDTRDVFALERDLTQEIAHQIQAQLTSPNQARLAQARPVNPKALEAYLVGSYYAHRFRDEEIRKAQEYFQQAIDADPSFAPAYGGMAYAHYGLSQPSREDVAFTRRTAEKALELDPTLSDAWSVLAALKLDSWDWSGAEDEYRKAIAVNPSSALAHEGLGEFLVAMGQPDKGLRECEVAQELDPKWNHLSRALYYRREFDRAIEVLLAMVQNDPGNALLHHDLYLNYAAKGMHKEAVQHLERAWTLIGYSELAVNQHHAFAVSGYTGAMRQYAKELEHLYKSKQLLFPVNLAGAYATLGDKDSAFYWLEQACKLRGLGVRGIPLNVLEVHPMLDPLRSDPRFKDLIHRLGLPA